MSPVHKSSVSFPCQPLFPIMGWELGTASPEQQPASQENQRLLQPSLSKCCSQPGFWGLLLGVRGSHHANEVLMRMKERAVKRPSAGLKIPPLSPGSSCCRVLTAQHGDSRSSQTVLCQQQTNWDCYLLALICQGSCLIQALIITVTYFLPGVPRAWSRAVSLGELLL